MFRVINNHILYSSGIDTGFLADKKLCLDLNHKLM